jgi:hypothetical protein
MWAIGLAILGKQLQTHVVVIGSPDAARISIYYLATNLLDLLIA